MISINVVNPIAFNYVLIRTGYTHRIQTIGRDTFQEEIEKTDKIKLFLLLF
jgi:hypothetical protein